MRIAISLFVVITIVAGTPAPQAKAGYGGITGVLSRKGCCKSVCDCQCYTVMKTLTRTVYDTVCETRQKVVYDTVWDKQTVQDIHRSAETHYRQEEFTYQRPVYETETHEVPYTVTWPVYETRSREVNYIAYVPSYETRIRSVPYTVTRTVQETRTRTVSYCVPRQVCYTKTISVPSGRWENRVTKSPSPVSQKSGDSCAQKGEPRIVCQRVWVPCVEERQVTCHKTVYDTHTVQVPYTVCKQVPEMRTCDIEYTVCRMMPVTRTRTVQYCVARTMSEQRTKTVSRVVTRMVTEAALRTVPYTEWRETPVCRTACVPRQVPRTVEYTVTRCVPRTECYQVPVRVCCPMPKGKGKGCDGDQSLDGDVPQPPQPLPIPAEPHHEDEVTREQESQDVALFQVAVSANVTLDAKLASNRFVAGLSRYRNGEYGLAAEQFQVALQADPRNAKYAYFVALALNQANRENESVQALAHAVELDRQSPIPNWGRVMERVQGAPRAWLEQTRREVSDAL